SRPAPTRSRRRRRAPPARPPPWLPSRKSSASPGCAHDTWVYDGLGIATHDEILRIAEDCRRGVLYLALDATLALEGGELSEVHSPETAPAVAASSASIPAPGSLPSVAAFLYGLARR